MGSIVFPFRFLRFNRRLFFIDSQAGHCNISRANNGAYMSQSTALTTTSPNDMLALIKQAATDPNIDVAKMHGLLDVQERMMAKQAEIEFNIALSDLQAKLPRIRKDGAISHNGKVISTYAKYETIDDTIRPLLTEFNFSLRFNTRTTTDGKIIITGTLAHRGGHSITDEIPLSIDASGAKNNVQGVGSTISYGKRYLVGMLLNLVFEGEDDDGQKAGYVPITVEQAETIKQALYDTNADVQAFLKFVGAKSVDEMAANKYQDAVNALRRKGASI
jgi:hypothetical protein